MNKRYPLLHRTRFSVFRQNQPSTIMNLLRFQFAVNHQDTRVVLAGLQEFLDHLCQVEDGLAHFLKPIVRSSSNWSADNYPLAQPILDTFFESSPQAEEFFALWEFPSIEYDNELCALDMDCLASVIEALPKGSPHLSSIVHRINTSSSKFIASQLEKKKVVLRNSVLRLLLAIQRKARLYDDLAHHLLLTPLMGKGKAEGEEEEEVKEESRQDEHFFIIKLLFSIMLLGDADIAQQLLTHGSNVTMLVNRLPVMSVEAYGLFLSGLVQLCEHGSRIQDTLTQKLLNATVMESIISAAAASPTKFDMCKSFLEALIALLASQVLSTESRRVRSGLTANYARRLLVVLVAALDPIRQQMHAEIELRLLAVLPEMSKHCIDGMKLSWTPEPSVEYLAALQHLVAILNITSTACKPIESSVDVYSACQYVFSSSLPAGKAPTSCRLW